MPVCALWLCTCGEAEHCCRRGCGTKLLPSCVWQREGEGVTEVGALQSTHQWSLHSSEVLHSSSCHYPIQSLFFESGSSCFLHSTLPWLPNWHSPNSIRLPLLSLHRAAGWQGLSDKMTTAILDLKQKQGSLSSYVVG